MIFAYEDGHRKVFPKVPLISFKQNKNLKAHVLSLQSPDLVEVGKSKPCGRKIPPRQ